MSETEKETKKRSPEEQAAYDDLVARINHTLNKLRPYIQADGGGKHPALLMIRMVAADFRAARGAKNVLLHHIPPCHQFIIDYAVQGRHCILVSQAPFLLSTWTTVSSSISTMASASP